MGNLAPPAVQLDSTDSRSHRRQMASVIKTLTEKLFTASAVNVNAAGTGDASKQVTCSGNPILLTGFVNITAAAATFTLKRGATVLVTLANVSPGQNIPFVWVDAPGSGIFTYSTDSASHTNAATLSVVELK